MLEILEQDAIFSYSVLLEIIWQTAQLKEKKI